VTESPFTFGVVSDEIDEDPRVATEVARDLGMDTIELGSVWLRPATALSSHEAAQIEGLVAQAGLRVNMILTPCLKGILLADIPAGQVARAPIFQAHMEELRRGIALARRFGAAVRIFSFRKEGMVGLGNPSPRLPRGGDIPSDTLAKIVEGLAIACDMAAEAGVTLALENVRSCYANTGTNTRRIVDAVGADNLKVIWDPANSFVSGQEAYPEGYEQLDKASIIDVHVKDAVLRDTATGWTEWACVGQGGVDYAGQLAAQRRDGYAGPLTIETHWQPREYATRRTFEALLSEARQI
jgi:sugar phosphate isomerase/epimerase